MQTVDEALANLERTTDSALFRELGSRFAQAGYELALVGGPVRDAFLGRKAPDLDFTTSAKPDEIIRVLKGYADTFWDIGREFGTIGARIGDDTVEITTYRADKYDPASRKPEVAFGTDLNEDLFRRDFTINSMALRLPEKTFVDPFNGLQDLIDGVIRTPGAPEVSFGDDPLRMMRGARFASQLGFEIEPATFSAMTAMAERIEIISAERVQTEFVKLMLGAHPRRGLEALVESGLAERVLPELPALKLEVDEHHHHKDVYEHSITVLEQAIEHEDRLGGPNLVIRLAALLHDIGKPKTRAFIEGGGVSFHHHEVVGARLAKKRLEALRFDNDTIDAVELLTTLHLRFHGYGEGEWTDSAVRRYVRDAGDFITHLHVLTRADCTTRNKTKAARLAATYDSLEARIEVLMEQEELLKIRPDLDGAQVMQLLNLKPSREVGQAMDFLLELRLEQGPIGEEAATKALLEWWASR